MLKDYRNGDDSLEKISINTIKIDGIKDCRVIDEAWDLFSEYIGEQRLRTPLSFLQFEMIFDKVARNEQIKVLKHDILKSLRYDSYSWPLVEREEKSEL